MSFRRGSFGGRGRGFGGGGGGSIRFGRGSGGRFSGGNRNDHNYEVSRVIPLGFFAYECQGDLICKVEIEDVPYFSAPIYLENKKPIGKIDEIFGNIKDYYVSVRLLEDVKAKSFLPNQKVYIDPSKLLPIKRFLPQPPGTVTKRGGGGFRGRGGGGFRGRGGGRPSFGRGGGGRPSFGGGRGGGGGFRGGRGGWKK